MPYERVVSVTKEVRAVLRVVVWPQIWAGVIVVIHVVGRRWSRAGRDAQTELGLDYGECRRLGGYCELIGDCWRD